MQIFFINISSYFIYLYLNKKQEYLLFCCNSIKKDLKLFYHSEFYYVLTIGIKFTMKVSKGLV